MSFGTFSAVYGTERVARGHHMANQKICPFYGKNDDYCDVGCGYISTHDVNMIIRYCSGRHAECVKYMELADRYPGELSDMVKC